MAFRTNNMPDLQEKSASGSVATFNTALAMPLPSCNIAVNAWQEGSGDPSPDNVRPISGWDAINIFGVGGNAWNEETRNGYYHASGGYYVNVAGQLCCKTPIDVLPNTTYRFCKPNTQGDVLFYDENGTYLKQYVGNVPKNGTFTTPSGCYKININLGNKYGATYNDDVIIAYPAGDKITIQIGSTVYGGYYDARTGVLTVTHGVVDLGTLNWGYSSSVFNSSVIATLKSPTNNIICSSYETVAYSIDSANMPDKSIKCYGSSENKIIYIKDINYTDPAVFKTAMSGVQLVYELSTPQTIQLPPCPIETLLGENNIWADTGDVDLTYKDLDIAKRGSFREVFKLPS